jgi:exosortase
MPFSKLKPWLGPRLPALTCALAGAALFQWLGNANQGYIPTRSLFTWWIWQWVDSASELQHAWILLALAVWLFARNLKRERCRPDRGEDESAPKLAAVLLCSALLLHGLGFQMQQARVSLVALLLYAWGVLTLWGGKPMARASVFPLSLMLFAIPAGFLDSAGFWLRLWVVDAGHAILRGLGVDVLRSGTQLFDSKGIFQYDVVAACSGVRSLQAMLALSLIAGYLRLRSSTGRCLAVLCSLPFVYAGNVLRIVAIVFAAAKGGQALGSRVHDYSGLPVFALVLGGVLGCIALMRRLRPAWAAEPCVPNASQTPAAPSSSQASLGVAWLMAACTLFCACHVGLWCRRTLLADNKPASGLKLAPDGINPVELPAFVGSTWAGRLQQPGAVERSILPPDTGYSRRLYASLDKPGELVFFSVVLSGRDRSSIHRPELCLVGQGWSIEGSSECVFRLSGLPAGGFRASLLKVRRQLPGKAPGEPELVAYWFVGSGEILATQGARMWHDALTRLSGKPERWAYILVQTGAADGEAAAFGRLQQMVDGVMPQMLTRAVLSR